jgi:hypothetical protein
VTHSSSTFIPTPFLPQANTFIVIDEVMKEIRADAWKHVRLVVADGASVNKCFDHLPVRACYSALRLYWHALASEISSPPIPRPNPSTWAQAVNESHCAAHVFANVIKHAFTGGGGDKSIAVITVARAVMERFRLSVKNSELLEAAAKNRGLRYLRALRFLEIRWNNCFVFLKRVLYLQPLLKDVDVDEMYFDPKVSACVCCTCISTCQPTHIHASFATSQKPSAKSTFEAQVAALAAQRPALQLLVGLLGRCQDWMTFMQVCA